MTEQKLNFELTEKNGDYGIIFQDTKPVAFAMFNKKDFSLAVAFEKGESNKYSKSQVFLSVFDKTNNFYGASDYRVTENNAIFNAHSKRYTELNN
ncbi:hypothetical protein [Polaribacter sp. IC063]|uniref:hypothetical protein n=1 Tax=Polaribacter sp. IC063 TaxID=57031 RepID=UPI0011BDF9F7|nr:hypothetical protein [Polaribacter sp. IC063]TXD53645.1 hypothetical protein ES043_03205 [Polaribacter sp. IC063]